jgi:hypothetical protein
VVQDHKVLKDIKELQDPHLEEHKVHKDHKVLKDQQDLLQTKD